MNWIFICLLIFKYASYVPVARGDEVYELDDVTINTYRQRRDVDGDEIMAEGNDEIANARENHVLQSSIKYTKQQHNVRLVNHGSQQYTVVITEQNQTKSVKNFTASGVFLLVLQLVGISANDNTDILVTFTNLLDALTFYTRGYLHTPFLQNGYRLQTVTLRDHHLRRKTILWNSNAALDVEDLVDSRGNERDYWRFTLHPSLPGDKAPVVMFIAKNVIIKDGNDPKQVVMAFKAGKGYFFVGLTFRTNHGAVNFKSDLHNNGQLDEDENAARIIVTDEIVSELFDD